jgi:hypothetical protein
MFLVGSMTPPSQLPIRISQQIPSYVAGEKTLKGVRQWSRDLDLGIDKKKRDRKFLRQSFIWRVARYHV